MEEEELVICPRCKSERPKGDILCGKCGMRLNTVVSKAKPVPPPAPPAEPEGVDQIKAKLKEAVGKEPEAKPGEKAEAKPGEKPAEAKPGETPAKPGEKPAKPVKKKFQPWMVVAGVILIAVVAFLLLGGPACPEPKIRSTPRSP